MNITYRNYNLQEKSIPKMSIQYILYKQQVEQKHMTLERNQVKKKQKGKQETPNQCIYNLVKDGVPDRRMMWLTFGAKSSIAFVWVTQMEEHHQEAQLTDEKPQNHKMMKQKSNRIIARVQDKSIVKPRMQI